MKAATLNRASGFRTTNRIRQFMTTMGAFSLDRLWEIVEREKIPVVYRDLSGLQEALHGLYIYHQETGPCIILDNQLQSFRRLHKCVLCEEIGHFYTSARTNLLVAHTSANLKTVMNQDERKALQWATDILIPDAELVRAVESGCRSCYELAEYFDVTEWFMLRKMGLLKMCFRRTGLKVRGRELFNMELQDCMCFN